MHPEPRRIVGLSLIAFLLWSGIASPLIEAQGFSGGVTLEAEHDLAGCADPHDHRICTQVGANVAVASRTQDHHVAHVLPDGAPLSDARHSRARPRLDGPPSLALPLT
ncbi:MAG: hypothetical protein FJ207_09155 [Gemmatimonadetes bacterium]|nr:hypothetical protein [Gemmatimonadota bacterium]